MSQGNRVALVRAGTSVGDLHHLHRAGGLKNFGARLAVVVLSIFLRAYQLVLSPILRLLTGSGCRFYPSCSEYALQAIKLHGPARGMVMAIKRLGRCHPFHAGGYDPPVHRS